MNISLLLPALLFGTLMIYLYRRDKSLLTFPGLLLTVYLFSSLSAVILDLIFTRGKYYNDAIFYYMGGLLLFIYPFLKFKLRVSEIKENKSLLIRLSTGYIIIGFIAIIYYIPSIYEALSGNLGFNRRLAVIQPYVKTQGTIPVIMSLVSLCFPHNLLLYFYGVSRKWNPFRTTLLLISSFSFIALSLANVGRDGIVLWSLTFFSIYFLFKSKLSNKFRKKLRKSFLIATAPLIVIFIMITYSRFSELSEYKFNPYLATLDYFGQQIRNFNDQFNANKIEHTNFTFNGTKAIMFKLGLLENLNLEAQKDNEVYMYRKYGTSLNVFSTFLGSFRLSFGNLITIFIGIVWLLVFNSIKSLSRFSTIFLVVFFYQIIIHGVFYYRQGLGFGDFSIYLTLLIFILLRANKS